MARFKILRYFAYTLEILVVFVLQETPGLFPPVFGQRPIALIPVALAIAYFESGTASMAFGILTGLLVDYGMGGALGFHALVLALVCYAVAMLAENLLRASFLTYLLSAVLLMAVVTLLQWLFYYVLYGYGHTAYALVNHYLPRYGYTVVLAPIAYYFNRALAVFIQSRDT